MQAVASNLLQRYSPFENHRESINDNTISSLYTKNSPDNKIFHQDEIFRIIKSCKNIKLNNQLCLWISIEYKKIELEHKSIMKFCVNCNKMLKYLKNCYQGFDIDYDKLFIKDVFKIIIKPKILSYILNNIDTNTSSDKILLKYR